MMPPNKKKPPLRVLVCPPRSGSNFLQALLKGSSGIAQDAFYGKPGILEKETLLKSHSVSYMHLLNEMGCFFPHGARPDRIIVMWRHPCYAVSSAFAYARYRKATQERSIEDFLRLHCDFYECGLQGGSYLEKYAMFLKHWNIKASNLLHISYEDLISDTSKTLARVYSFLGKETPAKMHDERLHEISRELQERWQGKMAKDEVELPLTIRQYPSEFHSDEFVKTSGVLWDLLKPFCKALGYGKPLLKDL
jgi:hypothetical protein